MVAKLDCRWGQIFNFTCCYLKCLNRKISSFSRILNAFFAWALYEVTGPSRAGDDEWLPQPEMGYPSKKSSVEAMEEIFCKR